MSRKTRLNYGRTFFSKNIKSFFYLTNLKTRVNIKNRRRRLNFEGLQQTSINMKNFTFKPKSSYYPAVFEKEKKIFKHYKLKIYVKAE